MCRTGVYAKCFPAAPKILIYKTIKNENAELTTNHEEQIKERANITKVITERINVNTALG